MENRLNKGVLKTEISGIRVFNEMALKVDDCIQFTIGEPNFESDPTIKKALKKALDKNMTHYGPARGLIDLRNKLSDDIYLRYGAKYDQDEIIITVGATEALAATLKTILNPNDQVIVFEPSYPGYKPLLDLYGAKYVSVDTSEDNFQLNQKKIERVITEKTKAIILTSPNNPTGFAYDKKSLNILAKCISNRDIFVICDNLYDEIVYEEIPSFITYQKEREKIIMIQSFSKAYAMAGFRIGYVIADKSITQHILKTHSYYVTGASPFVQQGAITALSTSNRKMVEQYKKRRDYACERLNAMGFDVTPPVGAFYLFLDISKFKLNSYDFAYQLLHNYKVCVVPGRYFFKKNENYIRISYACSDNDLKEGLNRIEKFVKDYESK